MSEWNRERVLGAVALLLCVCTVFLAVWEAPELAPAVLEPAVSSESGTFSQTGAPSAVETTAASPAEGTSAPASVVAGLSTASQTASAFSKININTATRDELSAALDGIGDTLAQRIIDYRDSHGGFASIEEIQNVSGIGEKRYAAIRDKITVG